MLLSFVRNDSKSQETHPTKTKSRPRTSLANTVPSTHVNEKQKQTLDQLLTPFQNDSKISQEDFYNSLMETVAPYIFKEKPETYSGFRMLRLCCSSCNLTIPLYIKIAPREQETLPLSKDKQPMCYRCQKKKKKKTTYVYIGI